MNKLALKLQMHNRLQFPNFPEDDDFADWVAELAETDGYYVGLAQSLLANCNIDKIDFSHVGKLRSSVAQFSSIEQDYEIYRQCLDYLQSIEECVKQMR